MQPQTTQCLAPGLAVTVAAILSWAPVGLLSVGTSMLRTGAPEPAAKASLAALTRSVQTVTSCFQAEMVRVSAGFQPAFLNSAAARLPTSPPIWAPLKPIRGTRASAGQDDGSGSVVQIWSSEVRRATLASLAIWATWGPTAGSGTTTIRPLLFCEIADWASLTVLFASLPRLTTFRSMPSSSALALALSRLAHEVLLIALLLKVRQ